MPCLHGFHCGTAGWCRSSPRCRSSPVACVLRWVDLLKTQSRLNPAMCAEMPLPLVSFNVKGAVFCKVTTDGMT